jgi:hypothetical protein
MGKAAVLTAVAFSSCSNSSPSPTPSACDSGDWVIDMHLTHQAPPYVSDAGSIQVSCGADVYGAVMPVPPSLTGYAGGRSVFASGLPVSNVTDNIDHAMYSFPSTNGYGNFLCHATDPTPDSCAQPVTVQILCVGYLPDGTPAETVIFHLRADAQNNVTGNAIAGQSNLTPAGDCAYSITGKRAPFRCPDPRYADQCK